MPKKKTVKPEETFEGLGDFNQFLKPVEKPKEMPKKKTERVVVPEVDHDAEAEKVFERMKRQEALFKPKEPVITSITINPNGTIFGLADNKVFVYDDLSKTWKQR
jgi:hypothetical protein